MRIECENCQTRYSVPDERVRGRVCRFRCRRCGHAMLLRGDVPAPRAADATVVEARDFGASAFAAPPPADEDPFAARAADVPDEEAFAPPERNLLHAPEEEPPPPAPALTGARSENSMLFSLDNLKTLAMTPAPQPRANGHATARNESSGLIDIRALAARTLATAQPEPAGEAAATFSVVPALAVQPAMTPLLMPEPERRVPPWAIALGAGGAMAAFAAIVLVAIVMRPDPRREEPAKPVATGIVAPTPPEVRVAALDTKPPAAPPIAPPGPALTTPPPSTVKPPAAPGGDSHERASRERHAARSAPPSPRTGSEKIAEKATEKGRDAPPAIAPHAVETGADKRDRAKKTDEISALLDDATKEDRKPQPRETTPLPADPDLPVRLDMRDVKAGMAQAQARVAACYAQFHVPGNAVVDASIAPSGRVESAKVGGALAGTPTGDCVARAVKSVTFKRFKGPAMSVSYPFILR